MIRGIVGTLPCANGREAVRQASLNHPFSGNLWGRYPDAPTRTASKANSPRGGGKNHDLCFRQVVPDFPAGLNAILIGQQHVHYHHVRLEFLSNAQHLFTGSGVTYHLEFTGAFQNLLQPDPHDLVMVGEEDPNPFS